jgi:hypothetical protein
MVEDYLCGLLVNNYKPRLTHIISVNLNQKLAAMVVTRHERVSHNESRTVNQSRLEIRNPVRLGSTRRYKK